jgi:hypothetical protein
LEKLKEGRKTANKEELSGRDGKLQACKMPTTTATTTPATTTAQ